MSVRFWNGVVQFQEEFDTSYYKDDRNLEDFLIASARERGFGDDVPPPLVTVK